VQSLAAKGIRPDTLKSRLKADMVWNAIVRGRFKQSCRSARKEVEAAVQGSGGDGTTESLRISDASGGADRSARRSGRHDGSPQQGSRSPARAASRPATKPNSTFQVDCRDATIRDTVVKTSADLPPTLRTCSTRHRSAI